MKTARSKLDLKIPDDDPPRSAEASSSEKGDEVVFEIEDGRVVVRKATPLDLEYLSSVESTLSERSSENDEEAYKDL